MEFGKIHKRPRGEAIVPMINIVFLLLIFFLMTATLVPRDPFESTLPFARSDVPATNETRLFVSPQGLMSFQGLEGPAAEAALSDHNAPLTVVASAEMRAVGFADVMARLRVLGIRDISIEVRPE